MGSVPKQKSGPKGPANIFGPMCPKEKVAAPPVIYVQAASKPKFLVPSSSILLTYENVRP